MKNIQDEVISMRWIGNEFSNELRTVYLLNYGNNWNDFSNAVRTFISISQNIVYADAKGNIGLYCSAGVPIREGNGLDIMPGDTSLHDWKGLVPFDKLPHEYNPERGYVSSANNKVAGSGYPYHVSHWFDLPYRIHHINAVLDQDKVDMDDMKALQTSYQATLPGHFIPVLSEELEQAELNKKEKKCLDIVTTWDANYQKDIAAPAIFETFYVFFVQHAMKDELGDSLYQEFLGDKILVRNFVKNIWDKPNSPWYDNTATEKKETRGDIIYQAFGNAVDSLSRTLGKNPVEWEWGNIHQLTIAHPLSQVKILDRLFNLNKGPYEMGGSFHTVCPYAYSYKKPFEIIHGASHRHLYVAGDWDKSWSIIPTGTSGIPASQHYLDQTEMYLDKKYHPDFVSREKVEKVRKYSMKMIPKTSTPTKK